MIKKVSLNLPKLCAPIVHAKLIFSISIKPREITAMGLCRLAHGPTYPAALITSIWIAHDGHCFQTSSRPKLRFRYHFKNFIEYRPKTLKLLCNISIKNRQVGTSKYQYHIKQKRKDKEVVFIHNVDLQHIYINLRVYILTYLYI